MDVLEILVLLIALVLIFLVVAVVLVVGQAMASKKEEEESGSGHAEAEPSVEPQAPLVQPADAVPPVEENAPEAEAKSEAEKVEEVQPEPVVETMATAEPVHVAAETVQATTQASHHAHAAMTSTATHHEQTHRVHEERHVDSDRHNKFEQRRDGIADDEIRRPAVEAGNSSVAQQDENFPYMSGGPLLSPIERLFYGDLKTSVSDKTEIFTKVRASDVINPKSDLSFEEAQFAAEQLATQRFDFVLCDSKDFSVLCVIELDGLSDREGLRKIQREILRKAAESANVPVLLVDMKRGYTIKEIRDRVSYLMPKETEGFVTESHLGHNKRKIADLITEVEEPEEVPVRQYAHSAFEEVENNSIHQFGNATHQHQRPQPGPSEYQPQYSHQPGATAHSQPATGQSGNGRAHNPFQEAFQQPPADGHGHSHHHTPPPQPSSFEQAAAPKPSSPTPDPAAFAEGTSTKCPRCSSPLKMSMATTGEFAGRYFWICTKLPECPYVAPITPPE